MKAILLLLFTTVSMAVLAQDAAIVQLEYFFDTDNGVGNNTLVNVTPAVDSSFPFIANINGLSVGYHKLYIRTKDNKGKWSLTARRNVEVFATDVKANIVSGEYFIDVDPGFGNGLPITITSPDSSIIMQNFTAASSGLSRGYHKLYGRLRDNFGRWGQTFRRNIEIYKNDTNYITKAEYFFKTDNGYGTATTVLLSPPTTDNTYSFNIPLSAFPKGADTLFIRVQDSTENKWSLTAFKDTMDKDTTPVLPLTLLNFNVAKQRTTAQLNWQTANEVNTAYFIIQRSTDGRIFTTLSKVESKNRAGNNAYASSDDISQLAVDKVYYRLEMEDKDGRTSYSDVKYIDISSGLKIVVSPNPVITGSAVIHIYSPADKKLQLMIYNNLATLIYNEQFSMQRGNITKTISFSNLPEGTYFIIIIDGTSVQTVKLIKQ